MGREEVWKERVEGRREINHAFLHSELTSVHLYMLLPKTQLPRHPPFLTKELILEKAYGFRTVCLASINIPENLVCEGACLQKMYSSTRAKMCGVCVCARLQITCTWLHCHVHHPSPLIRLRHPVPSHNLCMISAHRFTITS